MSKLELLKLAKYLDENGSYSVADDLDKDFIKVAQSQQYKFPIPTSYYQTAPLEIGMLSEGAYFQIKGIPALRNGGYKVPSYFYNPKNPNIKARPGKEFLFNGSYVERGGGDKWYADKLYEEAKTLGFYVTDKHAVRSGKTATEYAIELGMDKTKQYEYTPKGNLQLRGQGEWWIINQIKKVFPSWNPESITEAGKYYMSVSTLSPKTVSKKSQMFDVVYDETDPKFKKPQDKQKKVEQNTSDPFGTGWSK